MSNKTDVKPDKIRLPILLRNIENGEIQIPIFQRDFVWDAKKIRDLFDSIYRGYPIGSLLFWKPNEQYPTNKTIGIYKITSEKKGVYVLDGSQRITTLFSVLSNPKKHNFDPNAKTKKFEVYYDLKNKEFVHISSQKDRKYSLIALYQIMDTYEFLDFLRNLENEKLEKIELRELIDEAKAISTIFYDYEIPFVEIIGGDIKSAVEIFSRVNSTGMEISTDFMLSARSYNSSTGFLFSEEIGYFLNKLNKYNFSSLKRDTILQCMCNVMNKVYFDVKIEELLETGLETTAKETFNHIEKAIDFLYNRVFVLNVDLLPYPTQLIFIANFFRLLPNPSEQKLQLLEKWFWITSYTNYFTIYSLSQQRNAHNIFISFIHDKHENGILKYNDFSIADFPDKLSFQGVRPKTLQLFFLKNVCNHTPHSLQESIKEIFIFDKKDRSPSNIILTLGSLNKSYYNLKHIFENNQDLPFHTYLLNENLYDLYLKSLNEDSNKQDNINFFLEKRNLFIQEQENLFIKKLNII